MVDQTLVFVGGLHRSGTTALARALSDHPAVSGLRGTSVTEDEGQHLQTVYPAARAYGGPGRFAWKQAAHLTETSDLVSAQNARRLRAAWNPYWDLDCPYLVEKSPPNLVMARFLQALFPESVFVVVIRHPVVVALSTAKWAKRTPLARLVAHNLHAYRTFFGDLPHLQRAHVLRYEDLVADPQRTLDLVGTFLGIPGPMPAGAIQGGRSDRYTQRWEAMRVGGALDRAQRALIAVRFGASLAQLGYDAEDPTLVRPWEPASVARTGLLR